MRDIEREKMEKRVYELMCREGAVFEGLVCDLIESLWVNLGAGLFVMFNERVMLIAALIG